MNVTLFTTPRRFVTPFDFIQTNALKSWALLDPKPNLVLYGDDWNEGLQALDEARKLGFTIEPVLKRSPGGVPLVSCLFLGAAKIGEISCYINADIIVQNDLLPALAKIAQQHESFLAVCGRWNTQILDYMDFADGWQDKLWNKVQTQGSRMPECAIDLFAWRGIVWPTIPNFAIGRYKWDMWLVGNAIGRVPVIDITPAVRIIHQAHACVPWEESDALINHSIQGQVSGLIGCTHTLTLDGAVKSTANL
jgi:hypothetical protein